MFVVIILEYAWNNVPQQVWEANLSLSSSAATMFSLSRMHSNIVNSINKIHILEESCSSRFIGKLMAGKIERSETLLGRLFERSY